MSAPSTRTPTKSASRLTTSGSLSFSSCLKWSWWLSLNLKKIKQNPISLGPYSQFRTSFLRAYLGLPCSTKNPIHTYHINLFRLPMPPGIARRWESIFLSSLREVVRHPSISKWCKLRSKSWKHMRNRMSKDLTFSNLGQVQLNPLLIVQSFFLYRWVPFVLFLQVGFHSSSLWSFKNLLSSFRAKKFPSWKILTLNCECSRSISFLSSFSYKIVKYGDILVFCELSYDIFRFIFYSHTLHLHQFAARWHG